MSVAWWLYRSIAPALGAVAPAARLFVPADERPHFGERLGRGAPATADVWLHAASMGEASVVPALVSALGRVAPASRFHVTTTTRTGRGRLIGLPHPVSLAPLDTPQAVGGFLDRLTPRLLLLVETELWPHWLVAAKARGLPVAVVSARLSERSLNGYRRLGAPLRGLLAHLHVLAQSDTDLARWRSLGVPEAQSAVGGNLKFDALPAPTEDRAAAREALGLVPGRPLFTIGSARPGEMRTLAAAWRNLEPETRAAWQVAIIPRHAKATPGLKDEVREAGMDAAEAEGWRWDDRPGVLPGYYAGADIAFVGGSLAPFGGHNPLEPAACGAAVLMGPHAESQAPGVSLLASRDAIVRVSPDRCGDVLAELLASAPRREALGRAARAAIAEVRGASTRAAEQLARWRLWPATP